MYSSYEKEKIAHILNLSTLNPVWFKWHCVYMIAEHGIFMCVLGMAEKFKEFKGEVAVNA